MQGSESEILAIIIDEAENGKRNIERIIKNKMQNRVVQAFMLSIEGIIMVIKDKLTEDQLEEIKKSFCLCAEEEEEKKDSDLLDANSLLQIVMNNLGGDPQDFHSAMISRLK